ncbi:MAG TPA: hypothetical protein VJ697_05535 [Nitrososphaeraceae archaeon]|nr:hypothetical protein [Nitrososphaeraceae archaeon]
MTISLSFFIIISLSTGLSSFEKSYSHDFSPAENVHFLTVMDIIKIESELAVNSTGNNNNNKNQSSAQIHANNAVIVYDPNTKEEIAERNEKIAKELESILNQLLEEVKSQTNKTQLYFTVEAIDSILEEAITTRIKEEQINNSTIQTLIFSNLVNTALQKYGVAFNVGIDLRNTSNMYELEATHDNFVNNHFDLLNFSSYESALGFSQISLSKYYNDISTTSVLLSEQNNKTITNQNYLKKLENGLKELIDSIKNKENPMKVMEIVYAKIYPNLQFLQSK